MGYPELDRDESIILEAKNVKFKSISFDARLTNRRIILVDSRKNIIPPQEILLATIWQVDAGENAIRDHLLSLTILNNAGKRTRSSSPFHGYPGRNGNGSAMTGQRDCRVLSIRQLQGGGLQILRHLNPSLGKNRKPLLLAKEKWQADAR